MSKYIKASPADITGTHNTAEDYPLMSDQEIEDLKADIKANGQELPILIDQSGLLFDGRNRLRACQELGIEPRVLRYSKDDIEVLVTTLNLHRRHLTASQRAMLVAARPRQGVLGTPSEVNSSQPTKEQQAAEAKVSKETMKLARLVEREGTPEMRAAVENGSMSLKDAVALIRGQRRAAKSVKKTAPKPPQPNVASQRTSVGGDTSPDTGNSTEADSGAPPPKGMFVLRRLHL